MDEKYFHVDRLLLVFVCFFPTPKGATAEAQKSRGLLTPVLANFNEMFMHLCVIHGHLWRHVFTFYCLENCTAQLSVLLWSIFTVCVSMWVWKHFGSFKPCWCNFFVIELFWYSMLKEYFKVYPSLDNFCFTYYSNGCRYATTSIFITTGNISVLHICQQHHFSGASSLACWFPVTHPTFVFPEPFAPNWWEENRLSGREKRRQDVSELAHLGGVTSNKHAAGHMWGKTHTGLCEWKG